MEKNVSSPEISVIVPVYKVEAYLDRCVVSLLEQTFSDIEIILVDDGSPDRCPEMCDAYAQRDARVKVIHKENAGLGFARNSGLDVAAGEYVAFVDSDDYVTPDMCEKLRTRALETDADVVYGGIYTVDAIGDISPPERMPDKVWRGREQLRGLLLDLVATEPSQARDTVMKVAVWRALFRRRVLEEHHIRFVSERQFISEDIIFNIDLLQHCGCVATIQDPVYHYCFNPGSLTQTFHEHLFRRVKELWHEVVRRLTPLYSKEEVQLRCGRFLLARSRRNAMAIVHQRKNAGDAQVRRWLADICEDEDVRRVLETYPIQKLPLPYFAVAWLMKKRAYFFLERLLLLKRGR